MIVVPTWMCKFAKMPDYKTVESVVYQDIILHILLL